MKNEPTHYVCFLCCHEFVYENIKKVYSSLAALSDCTEQIETLFSHRVDLYIMMLCISHLALYLLHVL